MNPCLQFMQIRVQTDVIGCQTATRSSKFSKVKQNTSTITNKTSGEQKRLILR